MSGQRQQSEVALASELRGLRAVEYPDDPNLRARIRAHELACRMRAAVPEGMDLRPEFEAVPSPYGLDHDATKVAGERLLAARRLAERGVRFIQVYAGADGTWDSHQKLKKCHQKLCASVDMPVAGLLHDHKQRGLMNDVLVVFCHHVTDIHAAVLHLVARDGGSLEVPGRRRLDVDHGRAIRDIVA